MMDTYDMNRQYIEAMRAESYKVQLKNRITDRGFWVTYSPEQMLKAVGYLKMQNRNGFDVYCRPVGYQYVLLDDLRLDVLKALSALQPCMLLETSPNNFQAWLILQELPSDRDTAKAICKELAGRFGADLASAEPDHVGRLPGFTNRKEKHRLPNGLYPFVRLRRAQNRVSSFNPCGGAVLHLPVSHTEQTALSSRTGKGGFSEQDFGRVCRLIRQGKSDAELYEYLFQNSPNLEQRKGHLHIDGYIQRTIQSARRSVEKGGTTYT